MGTSYSHRCRSCGHVEEGVSPNFDYGMSGVVVTPVLCEEHGLVSADTGLSARDDFDWESKKGVAYLCPECGRISPVWDRRTCPSCGKKSMGIWREGPMMMWD